MRLHLQEKCHENPKITPIEPWIEFKTLLYNERKENNLRRKMHEEQLRDVCALCETAREHSVCVYIELIELLNRDTCVWFCGRVS